MKSLIWRSRRGTREIDPHIAGWRHHRNGGAAMIIDIFGLRSLADNLRPEYPVTMEELDKMLDIVALENEPDAVPQPDQILGNASRTLTLMDHRIDTVRKQLTELEEQREAFVRDLRKLGGGD